MATQQKKRPVETSNNENSLKTIDAIMAEYEYDKMDNMSIIPKDIDSGSISSNSDKDRKVCAGLAGKNDPAVTSQDLDTVHFSTSENSKTNPQSKFSTSTSSENCTASDVQKGTCASRNLELLAFSAKPDGLDKSIEIDMEIKEELIPLSRVIHGQICKAHCVCLIYHSTW
jgi:hypothetical protein